MGRFISVNRSDQSYYRPTLSERHLGRLCVLESREMESPLPLPVERAIHKLGSDISLARRRRHISQASLAERMGASLSSVRRMEKGDGRVPLHFFARALHVFGEVQALAQWLDTANDDIGLTLMDQQLPKRVRTKRAGSGAL
jgi:ribosome-binding protein aMBF1 (putative translation factor)